MANGLLDDWRRSLRARARSEAKISAYRTDADGFLRWAEARGVDLLHCTRRDIEAYLAETREQGLAAATTARRYRSLKQLYKWLAEEDEIDVDPMIKMSPPKVPDQPPPVIPPDQLSALIGACTTIRQRPGKAKPSKIDRPTYENARDLALVLLLSTTGVRAAEIMGLAVTDIDLDRATFVVMGKDGRARIVALMPKPSDAVARYLRHRRRHTFAKLLWLWLGDKGRLTDSGLRQLRVERRCGDAGFPPINPHRFRHTFAHEAKSRGMSDGDLMAIAGWTSPQMLHRYGASAAAERARESHLRFFGKD